HGDIPAQLSDAERAGYRAVFAALRAGRLSDATTTLAAMPVGLLHPVAQAEIYLAKKSSRVDAATLTALLIAHPELPEADRLAALARSRGAADLPVLPIERDLMKMSGAPHRKSAPTTIGDAAAAAMATTAQKLIAAGHPADAEALLTTNTPQLSVDAQVEWQARIAWGYYIAGDDGQATR